MESKKHVNAIDLLELLPYDKISTIAEETKVDYKAKKLRGLNLMVDTIEAMLSSSQVSQRILSMENSVRMLPEIQLKNGLRFEAVSHSSFSERLSKVNVQFFERSYEVICNLYSQYVPEDYLDEMSVTRVDSTMVAETANKLQRGFTTGVNDRFSKERKQVKYTLAYNGLGVVAARVFTKKTYSGDNAPISKVVHAALRKSKDMSDYYVFDRALRDVDDFVSINDLSDRRYSYFVGRLQLNRCIEQRDDLFPEDHLTEDEEVEVIADTTGYLRAKGSSKWDTSHQYRFIRVRFKKPRPDNPAQNRRHRRHFDEEMVLITNDFESEPITIVKHYRKRWDIEVFFKFLKQDLSFSHFISTSVNGIKVMLYMTLIVALLVKIYSLINKMGLRVAKLAIMNDIIQYHQEQIKSLKQEIIHLKKELQECAMSSDH